MCSLFFYRKFCAAHLLFDLIDDLFRDNLVTNNNVLPPQRYFMQCKQPNLTRYLTLILIKPSEYFNAKVTGIYLQLLQAHYEGVIIT